MGITEVLIRMEQSWVLGSEEGLFDKPGFCRLHQPAGGSRAPKLFLLKMVSPKPPSDKCKNQTRLLPRLQVLDWRLPEGLSRITVSSATAQPPRCS